MMVTTNLDVEKIVEVVTREVLLAIAEAGNKEVYPQGEYCTEECANGICVHTCFDRVGQVVSAGATRLTSSLGGIPDPQVAADQIAQLCFEARKYNFASVCVNPTHVELCADLLKGTDVKVCTVIGFPLGATDPKVKAFEAEEAIRGGATEIDMVINIGALKANDLKLVAEDIRGVVQVGHAHGVIVKCIIETALLTDEEKVTASLLAKEAGADFVKTSTGFAGGGATVEDVSLMRRVVGAEMGVKASGGVSSYQDAQEMVAAGATRIGASAGVRIVQGESEANGILPSPVAPTEKGY
jgi:deoxyribose-phosphate aldolase